MENQHEDVLLRGHCFGRLVLQEDHLRRSKEHTLGPFVGGGKKEYLSRDSHWSKIYHRVFMLSHFFLGFNLH